MSDNDDGRGKRSSTDDSRTTVVHCKKRFCVNFIVFKHCNARVALCRLPTLLKRFHTAKWSLTHILTHSVSTCTPECSSGGGNKNGTAHFLRFGFTGKAAPAMAAMAADSGASNEHWEHIAHSPLQYSTLPVCLPPATGDGKPRGWGAAVDDALAGWLAGLTAVDDRTYSAFASVYLLFSIAFEKMMPRIAWCLGCVADGPHELMEPLLLFKCIWHTIFVLSELYVPTQPLNCWEYNAQWVEITELDSFTFPFTLAKRRSAHFFKQAASADALLLKFWLLQNSVQFSSILSPPPLLLQNAQLHLVIQSSLIKILSFLHSFAFQIHLPFNFPPLFFSCVPSLKTKKKTSLMKRRRKSEQK